MLRIFAVILLAGVGSSLKCYVGEQTTKDKLPDSVDCNAAVAEYCCSKFWHNASKGYFVERGCSFEQYIMQNTTTAACTTETYEMTTTGEKTIELCCCYGDNCNHGDTIKDYMWAGVPLTAPNLCTAIWRPPLSVGAVYVFSSQPQNGGYVNGTTIRLQCPEGYKPKRDPAAFCIDGEWLAPDSNRCVDNDT